MSYINDIGDAGRRKQACQGSVRDIAYNRGIIGRISAKVRQQAE